MWKKIKKENNTISKEKAYITVRKNKALHISSALRKQAELNNSMYVEIHIFDDGSKIALEFFKEPQSEDSYKLSNDGGANKKKTSSLVIQSASLFNHSTRLLALSKSDIINKKRLFAKTIKNNFYEFNLIPCFEVFGNKTKPDSNANGIYMLMKNTEIVYIGKGKIANRVSTHKTNGFDFDEFKYSLIEDDDDCYYWEKYHIDNFELMNSKLPVYNKIRGIKK